MARGSSGIVAGLTTAALAAVGFLAYQASANAPDSVAAPKPTVSASAPATGHDKPKDKKPPAVLPVGSGTGKRVVYALKDRQVWLVDEAGKAVRTFEVMPSALSPKPGTYQVGTPRQGPPTKGSDGVMIEHVVRFTMVEGVSVGFSAAVDGSMESPDPTLKTGGVRMSRADGDAVWEFATIRTKVVVVP
ncbi:hypothetical protein ACIOHO_07390 [Streptomyces sp. NPDC087849]|uniref:hypothetical protein n=1 Tax=Streptomyces sp. NPDC087849 TaxID=3365808 RepID=UPI0037FAF23E